MDDFKKRARDWLYNSTREEFYAVLHEAKISPRQYAICEKRFVDGLMNYQIGMEMNISDKTVERDVAAAYDSVLRVLKSRIKRSPLVYDFVSYTKGLIFYLFAMQQLVNIAALCFTTTDGVNDLEKFVFGNAVLL